SYLPLPEIVSTTVYTTIAYTGTWLSWDISALVQKWLDGSITNYGVAMKDTDEGLVDTFIPCWSSEYKTDPPLRPKLEITYYVP
ncbi:MAG: DNRLRE domain-containing protein, partial [Candidatus Lokiarchaeota archaeon]|nr:DNRLRE domain-containing protein [Candidatus Lokiarchaeota archaeon]